MYGNSSMSSSLRGLSTRLPSLRAVYGRLRALRRLRTAGEVIALLRVLAVAPFFPALMRLPLPLVSRAMVSRRWRLTCNVEPERLAEVVETAQLLAHPIVRRGCLTRGLSLFWLLDADRAELRLCFGIGGPGDDYYGHCWLERGGEPYLEKIDPRERFPQQLSLPLSPQPRRSLV